MAADDAKLKLLPRHLQRSQPASSTKSKRRVTVEDENAADEESDRRSVFERLGPGGLQRNEKPKLDYGLSLKGHSKNEGEKSPDNLRLKFKGSKDRETKVRSQVVPLVVKKADDAGSDEDSADESDNWSIDNLEDKKERELEQRKQEIQRKLKALDDGDDAPMIDTKKSESSGSDSSPERVHRKKKDKQGKKKDKKKHKKSASEKEMSLERQGKRKHGSDEEEISPHKKKKKKNKERKHMEVTPPPPPSHISLDVRKHLAPKPSKAEPHLYEPDSPTSTHRSDSPDEKVKGKKKKKKAKMQVEAVPQGKSKKLLSPLKKVLKLKKGPASVSSSKRSRSESRDSPKRKQSRSSSSSSSGSSSASPVTKRRERNLSAEDRWDRGRVKSKSLERKKRRKQPVADQQQHQQQRHLSPRQHQQHHHHRSASSSSSSSSTTSSTARGVDQRYLKGQRSHTKRTDGQTEHHQQRYKKSKSPVVAIAPATRKDGRVAKRKRDTSAESWNRSKDRKGASRVESPQRQRQGIGGVGGDRGRQRGRNVPQEEIKGHRNLSLPSGRHGNDSKDRGVIQQGPKDRLRRGQDASHDRNQKDGRDREKEDRRGRRDESREGLGPMGGQGKERDRMDDRQRRMMGAGGGPAAQMGERGGRMLLRHGNSADRDRRNFGGGDNSGRMGHFARQDFDRGPMGGRMGHHWDDRDGRRDVGGDWDSGREMRSFGGHREDVMVGGKRRDGGREERMLPQPGRGPPRSSSQDRLLPRGHGQREEFGAGLGRDRRGGSQEADGGRRDRDNSRGAREDNRTGRGGRDEGGKFRGGDRDTKPINEDLNKERDRRERDLSRSDRAKGPGSGRGEGSGVSPSPSSSRVVSKLRTESTKEDSPGGVRGESSLAAVFDQTETTRASNLGAGAGSKKRPTKTFGGKKSPKKPSDDVKTGDDKSRIVLGGKSGSLPTRGRRLAGERRGGAVTNAGKDASQPAGKKITPSRDASKEDGKTAVKQESISKERASPASQKSADSRHSHSKSSKRSSRSPADSRREGGNGAAQDSASPSFKKSPHKRSQSPAASPLSANQDRGALYIKDKDGGASGGDAGRSRKKEEVKGGDSVKAKEADRSRCRSQTPSDADAKTSPDFHDRMRRKSSDSIESLPAKLDGGDIAAAMLGDGLEDGQQDVFSDWSDDDVTFNTIIDSGPRKHHVEDLDGFGSRGHGHHDSRGRRGSPLVGDQVPDSLMMHGMGSMDHAGIGVGPGHHDPQGLSRGRDFHHQHAGGGGRYFGGNEMSISNGQAETGAGGGSGGHRGNIGTGRMDHNGKVDELLAKPALEKNIPDVKIVEDVQKEKPARERRRRNSGEEGYEEISSDENDLDEEGEKIPKRTIVSILDIDMSSLVQITKPSRPLSPSMSGRPAVFQRFKACSVFSQLGLSRRLVGEKLFAQVQEVCQKQLEQEIAVPQESDLVQENGKPLTEVSTKAVPKPPIDSSLSSQPGVSSSTSASVLASASASSISAKSEQVTSTTGSTKVQDPENSEADKDDVKETFTTNATASPIPSSTSDGDKQQMEILKPAKIEASSLEEKLHPITKPEFKLYGDTPADHIMRKARAQDRASLLGNFGLFRRALTARKDLDIRRQLCKIDSKYDQSAIYPAGLVDPDMFRMSLQMLRQKKAAMATAKVS